MTREVDNRTGVRHDGTTPIMVFGYRREIPLLEKLSKYEPIGDRLYQRFVHLYLACADEKAEVIMGVIRGALAIPEGALLRTRVNPQATSLVQNIRDMLPQMGKISGRKIMVYATGYEDYFAPGFTHPLREYRGGHDYDQELTEERDFLNAQELKRKSVFMLTHVGTSQGQDAYDRGVQSASRSQFVDDVFLVDRPSYLK